MAEPAVERFDVLTMGRSGVDLYPQQIGVGLEQVQSFGKFLGGSATNVAVAAARLGRRSAVISRTGADPFGTFIRDSLVDLGVDNQWVQPITGMATPVTFCEIFPPDDFPLYFYRDPKAPDLCIEAEQLPDAQIRDAAIFWATLTGLSAEPSRDAHHRAWRLRGRREHTILDLDYRPGFWACEQQAHEEAVRALAHCTIAIGNREECRVAVGETDPRRAARALLDRGVEIAVVKQGPDGVLAMSEAESHWVPGRAVEVVNGLGAGDGFGGAFCHGLLSGLGLAESVRWANAAGALVASRLECSSAMPTAAELSDFLAAGQEPVG